MKNVFGLLVLVPACVFAQGAPPPPLAGPPIRQLAAPARVAAQTFGAVNGVRPLPDGRLLVNDGFRRRLSLFDSTLATSQRVCGS